jgi:hypothetical protein
MNAALYFPHTTIRSPSLLRESLLLWDRVATIVPWEGWEPAQDLPPAYVRAQELVVTPRVPSHEEQLAVHETVAALVGQGLPNWLLDISHLPSGLDLTGSYGIYGKKFLPETWQLLEDASLARVREFGRRDYDVPRGVGLLLLAAIAEECAGQRFERITDQQLAYSCLTNWLAACSGGVPLPKVQKSDLERDRERLVSISVSQVSTDGVPIERLVALREEEVKRPGSGLFEFRANYRKRIDECLSTLGATTKPSDHQEILAHFEQSMASDLANLRTELRLEKGKLGFNRDVIVGLVVGAGVVVPSLPEALQVPVASVLGIAGIAKGYADYLTARRKVLTGHPMSWLYLAKDA